jgi:glycosyltransferase involved in cell wall biosynthesis
LRARVPLQGNFMSSSVCDFPIPVEIDRPAASAPRALLRALHVINGEHYSGAERVQDLLAANLRDFGFDVGFACLKPGRFDAMRISQLAPLSTLSMRSRFDLRPAWQLARIVRAENYALIHTHTPRAAMIGSIAARLTGVPLVHHVHSPTGRDSTRRLQDSINARIERFSISNAAAVIAVSGSLAEYAATLGVAPQKIHVVPNGVPALGPLASRNLPTGTWTLGTVALFRPRKGLEVLLDAMAALRLAGHDVRLHAVGEFETAAYREQIEAQVARLEIGPFIEWTGFTQDVVGELTRLDLFVLPSLFGEGLPMVVLEAMAAGIPVVGTRVEGVPEAIRDGVDGLLARPNDSGDLARAIAEFIRGDADWSAIRQSAHRRQAERFSAGSMARGVAKVYREVLAR